MEMNNEELEAWMKEEELDISLAARHALEASRYLYDLNRYALVTSDVEVFIPRLQQLAHYAVKDLKHALEEAESLAETFGPYERDD